MIGFALNCPTVCSDENKQRAYLHYASHGRLFGLCKREYSRNVALLRDYNLYVFMILVLE